MKICLFPIGTTVRCTFGGTRIIQIVGHNDCETTVLDEGKKVGWSGATEVLACPEGSGIPSRTFANLPIV